MSTHDHVGNTGPEHPDEPSVAHRARGRARWVFAGFAAIAVVLLAVEHRMHLLGWLPWLLLLACPLMHLFLHGHGHGGHGHGHRHDRGDPP